MSGQLHDDELDVPLDTVRRLLDRDVPAMRHLPLSRLPRSGSSNVLFRLGEAYLARFPRQPGGGRTIAGEARWISELASALPVAVPEFVTVGGPGFGYPERWSVTRRLDGRPATAGGGSTGFARDLAAFVTALHRIAVPAAAASDPALRSYRAGPLADIDDDVRGYLEECRRIPDLALDVDACLDLWSEAVAFAPATSAGRWVHADLLAENLLLDDGGRLAAVLDFGALAVGDASVDLVVAWEVLDPAAREVFRSSLDLDDATWQRGRAWALALAVMTFPYYWTSMPERCAARLVMAEQVLNG